MNQTIDTFTTGSSVQPEKSSPVLSGLAGLAVAAVACVSFLTNLGDEPYFPDESAMIAQSYYYTLVRTGQWDHPDWLHYAAYDHPPLPKYFFGLSLEFAGLPVPGSLHRWMRWIGMEQVGGGGWRPSPQGGDFTAPADPRVLFWARVSSALFGSAGVVAIYVIGLQIYSRWAGLIAAGLLILNPLYFTHARRAMSDSFAECLVAASFAAGLWGCRLAWRSESSTWKWCLFTIMASLFCGLAALAKLNGGIAALMVVTMLSSTALFKALQRSSAVLDKLSRTLLPVAVAATVGVGSFAVFVLLNPLMTATPPPNELAARPSRELAQKGVIGRARFLVDFRRQWSADARANPHFQSDSLKRFSDRVRMTAWEGFGRFSPLGPRDIRTQDPRPATERFASYRRWTCTLWLPMVVWGMFVCGWLGWSSWRAGRAPLAWHVLLYAAVCLATVVFMIPLNWDRYYLPLQIPASTLVSVALAATAHRLAPRA